MTLRLIYKIIIFIILFIVIDQAIGGERFEFSEI